MVQGGINAPSTGIELATNGQVVAVLANCTIAKFEARNVRICTGIHIMIPVKFRCYACHARGCAHKFDKNTLQECFGLAGWESVMI